MKQDPPRGGSASASAANGTAMLTLEVVREGLLASLEPVSSEPEEWLVPADAHGRVLARALRSAVAVPPWPNSAMDGYAVRTADLADEGPTELPVSQRISAGDAPAPLAPGCAARIFTGAPLPDGADAVIIQERCTVTAGGVRFHARPEAGTNIRRRGEAIRPGSLVLPAGRCLEPADIGLAASIGVPELPCARRARVAAVVTGDELAAAGRALGPGQIYDANGPLLAALLARLGCEAVPVRSVEDTPEAIGVALDAAAGEADLVLASGGVSVGETDHVKAAVAALGSLDVWRVALKPGKPLALGWLGETPFVGLPGNPVSLFVTFVLLAAPVIRRLQGRTVCLPEPVPVLAGFERPAGSRFEEYLRVRVERGRLQPFGHQGSGILGSVAWADGLARVPAGAAVHPGDPIEYYALASLLA